MMGCRFDEIRDIATARPIDLGYVVPDVTIASLAAARALSIRGEEDLFGGVVPFPFVAAKTITHPLIDPAAVAPPGWRSDFPERVRAVTLPGWSAFSPGDVRAAGRRLLQGGDGRIKPASGIGGAGQSVARDKAELEAQLAAIVQWLAEMLPEARRDRAAEAATTARQAGMNAAVEQAPPEAPPKA